MDSLSFYRKPFVTSNLTSIVQFIEANPVPPAPDHFSEKTVQKFIAYLSSSAQVMDVFQNGERVAFAALLDRIKNPSACAVLEILGIKKSSDPSLLQFILKEAEKELPTSLQGILIGHDPLKPYPVAPMILNAYEPFYEVVDMTANIEKASESYRDGDSQMLSREFRFEKVTDDNFDIYRALVVETFNENRETSIPDEAAMKNAFQERTLPVDLLYENDQAIGFVNVSMNAGKNSGEINTIALLKRARKRGLGKILLVHALETLKAKGVKVVSLTVESTNLSALKLYETFGFKIEHRSMTYRKRIKRD